MSEEELEVAETEGSVSEAPAEPLVALCPNCSTEISGPFCPTCGQQQKTLNKYVWTLLFEFFDDVFRLDSRASRTLGNLIFKPGYLTTEYFAGRRARYVPPIRLYLVVSFLFFFILPMLGEIKPELNDARIVTTDTTEETDWRDELDDVQIDLQPFLTEEENKEFQEAFVKQLKKAVDRFDDNPQDLVSEFMDLMSAVMFFLLPFFAILLKVVYLGSGVYYAEHLLLAVHNHCFLFVALLVSGLLELGEQTEFEFITGPVETVIAVWIPVYMYISMKHTYQQGHFLTALKFVFLAFSYWVLALCGFLAAVIVGVMSL